MKYNAFFKFLALILAVCAVVGALGSALFVFCNLNYGMYTRSPEQVREQYLADYCDSYAHSVADWYAYSTSGMPREIWENWFGPAAFYNDYFLAVDYWLADENGEVVVDTTSDIAYAETFLIELELWGGSAVKVGENWESYTEPTEPVTPSEATNPATDPTTESEAGNTDPTTEQTAATLPPEVVEDEGLYDIFTTSDGDYYKVYREEQRRHYTVQLCFTRAELDELEDGSYVTSPLGVLMHTYRYISISVMVASLVVLLLMLLYLACAAGHKPGTDEIRPGGLNRLPLDLYVAVDCFLGFWLLVMLSEGVIAQLFELEQLWDEPFWVLVLAGVGCEAGIGLICVLFWMALCAQLKAGDGFWWKNTLIGRVGRQVWRLIVHVLRRIVAMLTGVGGKAGDRVLSIGEMLRDMNNKLPLMWQWLAMSLVMFLLLAIFGLNVWNELGFVMYLVTAAMCVALIIYGARAFGSLRQAAKQMSQGNLDVKIDPERLDGCFKDFAYDLNALSDACINAAREQMKSERMRTELITNVSHDIKTPLTSIINYVDLLQKAESEEQRKEYLEVLERQSARLKKLIEDLMEMSKASSGNVAVELTATDVTEAVNQALGEYADRFAGLHLNVVQRRPEGQVMAMCDGKLLWRVMSNVMGNIVKYAMPGTRVYLDLSETERKVEIALKNISREELNISAGELMERFVRGDESRNTEGNGLGLNIAKSLMEVQGGALELVVDGDLFKVVLTLPRAEEAAAE